MLGRIGGRARGGAVAGCAVTRTGRTGIGPVPKLVALCLVGFLAGIGDVHAWGAAGHAIVAEIAQRGLDPAALAKVRDLLGDDRSLASVSSWADGVALTRPTTRRWHFVNIPYEAQAYEAGRDCAPVQEEGCVVSAIERFRATLSDGSRPVEARREALLFLVHLVADAHQPLHCADRGDSGGSLLEVTFLGQQMSLHQVWDVGLVESLGYDWGGVVDRMAGQPELDAKDPSDPVRWVWDTHLLAVHLAYDLPGDLILGSDYVGRTRPAVERQLLLAGQRLQRLLSKALRDR